MIPRLSTTEILESLEQFPAVAILGPRQIGKTTLALEIAETLHPSPIYLDLESYEDLSKLSDPESYFKSHTDRLIILDEIQRLPQIFQTLRSIIDQNRRKGRKTGQFLILGSASLDLLQQSSESLAGRICYKELSGLTVREVNGQSENLWVRGGFPESFLAKNDSASFQWRQAFIRSYLERDVPMFGPRIPATTLRRLWIMLAHNQANQLNMAQLGASLELSTQTVKRYIDLLEDLILVRTLRPWFGNLSKRLVKTPKVYLRDSGLAHALLSLTTLDDILSHPVAGGSWEAFVIENILSALPSDITPWFYRTAAGAEIDLVLEQGTQKVIAIEIKRSVAPNISKGFYMGCEDIKATHRFLIYPGNDSYSIANQVQVTPLTTFIEILHKLFSKTSPKTKA